MKLSLTGTRVTFEDGTVVHMSLQNGFKLLCSLLREGWVVSQIGPVTSGPTESNKPVS